MRTPRGYIGPIGAIVAVLILIWPSRPSAHDIPADVVVQMFVKPEGSRLRLLVRVPLVAMRDIDFPKRGPGYLDLARVGPYLRDAATLWIGNNLEVFEHDSRLGSPQLVGVQVSLPSDRSFQTFEEALGHVQGTPLPADTDLYWNQSLLDLLFDYPISSAQSEFSIRPSLGRLGVRVVSVLRFVPPGGAVRAFEYTGDPGLVHLDPRWHQAALQFVRLGFLHILDGTDHLLFLICLVTPIRRLRPLVLIITSFTAAHSITLIASALNATPDVLWFPPLIEVLIAISIVYMALENIVAPPGESGLRRRLAITFAFGLVHGFGFSFALRETAQFAGTHLLTSLLSFNLGVELGQLLVLALLLPALYLLFRYVVAERLGTIILSVLVAHTAWHWTTERAARLKQFTFTMPDAMWLAGAVRALMVAVIIAAILWVIRVGYNPAKAWIRRLPWRDV